MVAFIILYFIVGAIIACLIEKYELSKARSSNKEYDGLIIEKVYAKGQNMEYKANFDIFIAIIITYPILVTSIILLSIVALFSAPIWAFIVVFRKLIH